MSIQTSKKHPTGFFLSQIGHLNILISYAFYMQVYIPDENIL